MVKVKVHGNPIHQITVKGHADSGEYGFDLVCAEISAICVGTMNAIDTLYPDTCILEMESGYVNIKVQDSSEGLQTILKTFVIQMQTVEFTNKKYVKIEKDEV